MTKSSDGSLRPAVGDPGVWRQRDRTRCPACGHTPNSFGHSGTDGPARPPRNGDFSVCIRCGEVGIIELSPIGVASIREATLAELAEFNTNPANTALVHQMITFNARLPRLDP